MNIYVQIMIFYLFFLILTIVIIILPRKLLFNDAVCYLTKRYLIKSKYNVDNRLRNTNSYVSLNLTARHYYTKIIT